MMATMASMKEWQLQNPLRKWRAGQKLPRNAVAAMLDKSSYTVLCWEQGSYQPSPESIEEIAEMMEVKPETLQRRWNSWWASAPGRK